MLNNIKRLDVSMNKELTSERVGALLLDLSAEQKLQIKEYDITDAILNRSKTKGNISVKVAAILALVTGVDPFYLSAETDQKDITADEDRVREFLCSHGYEKALNISDDTENKVQVKEKKPRAKKASVKAEPFILEEEFFITEPEAEEPDNENVMSIQEFADIQMANLSEDDKKLIFEMPEDDFTYLLKTLELQSKYTDKVKNLVGLIRLILIR